MRSTALRQATRERAIDDPVALDNDDEIWSAFDDHYGSALDFVDADGVIRDHHFGEGRYEHSGRVPAPERGMWLSRYPRRGRG